MDFTTFTAGKDDEGKRLDRVVRAVLDGRATTDNGVADDSKEVQARDGHALDSGRTWRESPDNKVAGGDRPAPGAYPATSVNIFQALRKRLIKLNGSKTEASARVHEGDKIEVASFLLAEAAGTEEKQAPAPAKALSSSPLRSAHSGKTRLDVLFQNDDIMFINKRAGISVQPSSGGRESISQIVRAEWEAAGPHGSLSFIPAPLHRLDRYTSGILAVSRSARGAAWFSRAIQERTIRKFYLGICMGRLDEDALWEDRLASDGESEGGRNRGFHTVRRVEANEENGGEEGGNSNTGGGNLARTRVHPVCHGRRGQDELTLVQYELLTGRKHQIRAQSALHGHPLYGDTAYGGRDSTAGGRAGGGAFFLHAFRMEFSPDNPLALPNRIEAPLPETFERAVRGWFKEGTAYFAVK
ncbi:MAG: RluA family pseudouridine synthase [Treponema sp.]|nr:RluA family pseudouridine synthase [Treponema sp.]